MDYKLFFISILASSIIDAAPVENSPPTTIIRQEYTRTEDGYKFEYQTSDGQSRQETGTLVTDGMGNQYMQVEGYFSYIKPDGEIFEGNYRADKDGYTFTPIIRPPPLGISNNVLLSLVG